MIIHMAAGLVIKILAGYAFLYIIPILLNTIYCGSPAGLSERLMDQTLTAGVGWYTVHSEFLHVFKECKNINSVSL